MQKKLKENISKSEHFAELFAEREGATIFCQVGTNPKDIFFSTGHESQGVGHISQGIISVDFYCTIKIVWYSGGINFKKIYGHDFREEEKKIWPWKSVQSVQFRTFCIVK